MHSKVNPAVAPTKRAFAPEESSPSKRFCYDEESWDTEPPLDVPEYIRKRFLIPCSIAEATKVQVNKSLALYSTTREKNAHNPGLVQKILVKEVELLMKINEFQIALDKLHEILLLEPTNVDALAQRSLCYAYLEQFELALADAHTALQTDPQHLRSLLNLVIIYVDGFHELAKAEEHLKLAAQYHPKNQQVIGYSKSLKIDLSRIPGSDLNQQPPKANADSLFMNARKYLANKQTSLALENFSQAILADPNHLASRICRGNIYKDQGRLSEAKEDYSVCLGISPDNRSALFGLACCEFIERNYETALEHLNRILLQSPAFINGQFLRGEIYRKLSRFSEALVDFNSVVGFFTRLKDSNDPLLSNLRNKKAFARALARRGLVRYKLLGGPQAAQKDIQDTLEDFHSALQLSQGDTFVYNTMAGIFLDTHDYEQASFYLNESFKQNPNDVDTLITAGRVYRAQKIFDKAEEAFKRAIEIKDKAVFAHYHLVGVYLDTKAYKPALEMIDKILSFHQDDRLPPVRTVIQRLMKAAERGITVPAPIPAASGMSFNKTPGPVPRRKTPGPTESILSHELPTNSL